jgi:thiamine-phosphate pyrophosphorylase
MGENNLKEKLKDVDLYFITDSVLTRKTVLEDVEAAIRGGVKIIQYREKKAAAKQMVEEAVRIRDACRERGVIFLVNDRVDVAIAVDADGVHLGRDDMPYQEARKMLGDRKIIGLTAHNVEEAVEAERAGADYIGLSPIFRTDTKKDAGEPAGLKLIRDVKGKINIPFFPIGGINQENLKDVLEAGARGACMISAIVAKDDVEGEVKKVIGVIRGFRK